MAASSLKPTTIFCSPAAASFRNGNARNFIFKSCEYLRLPFVPTRVQMVNFRINRASYKKSVVSMPNRSVPKYMLFAVDEETAQAQTETLESYPVQESETGDEDQDNTDGDIGADASIETHEQESLVLDNLRLYKEALANNDVSKAAEIESILKTIEDEKYYLERKVLSSTEELSLEKDRTLRISADFDNFRKRTERERASLVSNAQGEVVEKLLQVLDNFERAKAQIKVETEAEEKINGSYQSIYKQFMEILGSLGVVSVETVGKPFDPMLHEAIMREDSNEYEDGIIIEEYRKGFQLGDRLLRPSMVKVSSGPGPLKPNENDDEALGSGLVVFHLYEFLMFR